jgi:predicted TIM-barrel fold metal-dependent hydrolase
MWDLAPYKNIYLKITSRTVEHMQAGKATPVTFMRKLIEVFGSDRLLWGSNFPAHDDTLPNIVKETLHVLESVSDADRAQILSGTAMRLYPTLK